MQSCTSSTALTLSIVTEVVCGGRDIKIEVYRMKDAEAAFGIFSVSRFRCNGGPKLTEHHMQVGIPAAVLQGTVLREHNQRHRHETQNRRTANEIAAYLIMEQIADPPFDPGHFFVKADSTMRQ
ncbi:MAG: hypothetical protein MZV63_02570 [Marinilabiliales bacterium]|nr:hypothetical protein [Marinilabiliales bacterium]